MGDRSFDSIIIGAGQAGPSLAVTLAKRGEKVALIEAERLGGTCINNGCTPTKTLRKSARVAYIARRAAEFGIDTGPVTVDFPRAMARMRERVDTSRAGLESWVRGSGVEVIIGHGKIEGREGEQFRVNACGEALLAAKLLLNTGTRPFMPPIPGLDGVPALDNRSLLALDELPGHLVIIGGSYIGLEMAQIFRRLGADVTVIEGGPALASRENPDISAMIREFLEAEGITVHTGAKIEGVSGASGTITVRMDTGVASGTHLLVATGRLPNTDGVWALGDINGRGAFTHTSYHDFEIVAENLARGTRSADERVMAYAMFTDPPLGHVGIQRYEAQKLADEGRNILIAEHDMKDVSRAKEESELTGRIRIIVDGDDGKVLGATMLGINADEIIQVFSNFMAAGGHWQAMRNALPVHPTVTEFMPTILAKLAPLTKA